MKSARTQRGFQDRHEFAIAQALAEHLATTKVALVDLVKGDEAAGEPDVVGQVDGKPHGVEIVDAWYSEADARGTWGLVRELERTGARGSVAGSGFSPEDLAHPSGDPFVAVLQRALGDHGRRVYGIPTWLVLNASGTIGPLHSTGDGARLVRELVLPARFSYVGAFLYLAPNGFGGAEFFPLRAPQP